jgi:histone arginine demethylase JMJD6
MGFIFIGIVCCLELKWKGAWRDRTYYANFDTSTSSFKESASVARIHVNEVSLEEFIEKFERPYVPCVILGATDKWDAQIKWTPQVIIFSFKVIFLGW